MTTEEIVNQVIELAARGGDPNLQPNVLMHQNIDSSYVVVGLTSCYVNDSLADTIKELIEGGWTLFRVQTELRINGHETMAYFAKLKKV